MENQSNRLLSRVIFKSLLIPSWFGAKIEDWIIMQDKFGEFFSQTLVELVVIKLLDEENSPDYWIDAKTWPYPDKHYFEAICAIIDLHSPPEWGLEIRTFWFAYMIQHVRQQTMALLGPVYYQRLKQQ